MPASLFDRATRYPESAGENRLTEITAAVLERDPPLARAFARALVDQATLTDAATLQPQVAGAAAWLETHARTAEVRAETQVARASASARGIVDLQLRLTADSLRRDRDLLLWIEVKHGADISGEQLGAYRQLILREPAEVALTVVLVPRQAPPTETLVPPDVPVVFWHEVVAACLRTLGPRPRASAQALLVDEFTAYLKEQNLMPPQPLTTESALALAVRQATNQTIVALQEEVHRRVKERYADEGAHGVSKPQYGTNFWAKHSILPADPIWRGGWLEWGLRQDDSHPDSRQAYAFVAGLTFHRNQSPLDEPQLAEWTTARRAEGFHRVIHDKLPRLWSYRYPEQLLIGTTLEAQIDQLANWVLERFDALMQQPNRTR